jgi:hypothetical protein
VFSIIVKPNSQKIFSFIFFEHFHEIKQTNKDSEMKWKKRTMRRERERERERESEGENGWPEKLKGKR